MEALSFQLTALFTATISTTNSENVIVPFIRDLSKNFQDNGTVGNYWSDYTGADVNGDGIGDSPYTLETFYKNYELNKKVTVQEGKDSYPLMSPLDINNVTIELPARTSSPSVHLISPKNTTYTSENVNLGIHD